MRTRTHTRYMARGRQTTVPGAPPTLSPTPTTDEIRRMGEWMRESQAHLASGDTHVGNAQGGATLHRGEHGRVELKVLERSRDGTQQYKLRGHFDATTGAYTAVP